MTKWIWCGTLAVVLGAAAAALKFGGFLRPVAPEAVVAAKPATPRPNERGEAVPPHVVTPPKPAAKVQVDLNEPIETVPLPVEVAIETALSLPPLAGAEESAAGAAQAPRPDRETRRMPYADEPQ